MKKFFTFLFAVMAALQLNSANYSVTDFEDGQLGSTKVIWSAGSCSIVDNPYKGGINSSNKALAVVNNAWVPVTMSCTLPEGKTWYDYQSVKVKFCLTAGTDLDWAQVQIGLCTGDWGMEQIGVLSPVWESGALGVWYSVEVPIDPIKLATYLSSNSNPTYLIVKYDKSAGNNFMIDDVELVPTITSAVETVQSETVSMAQTGKNIFQVNSDNADATYTLSGINGCLLLDGKAGDGKIIIDLNNQSKGVYLLKVQSGEQVKTYKLVNR